MAVRGGSGRFADSSSLTSVETMPSPKTEVRPYRKLSRRRSSLRERENSIHLSHEPSKVLGLVLALFRKGVNKIELSKMIARS